LRESYFKLPELESKIGIVCMLATRNKKLVTSLKPLRLPKLPKPHSTVPMPMKPSGKPPLKPLAEKKPISFKIDNASTYGDLKAELEKISKQDTISDIAITNCNLSDDIFPNIILFLKTHSLNVEEMDFSSNTLSIKSAVMISNLVPKCPKLRTLTLSNNGFNIASALVFEAILNTNPNLELIMLGNKGLRSELHSNPDRYPRLIKKLNIQPKAPIKIQSQSAKMLHSLLANLHNEIVIPGPAVLEVKATTNSETTKPAETLVQEANTDKVSEITEQFDPQEFDLCLEFTVLSEDENEDEDEDNKNNLSPK
jgi:hypothetical protein